MISYMIVDADGATANGTHIVDVAAERTAGADRSRPRPRVRSSIPATPPT